MAGNAGKAAGRSAYHHRPTFVWSTRHDQGPARQQGGEEAEVGARPESARPVSKFGAEGRERAATKETVANPRRPQRRGAERRAHRADEHDAGALQRVTAQDQRSGAILKQEIKSKGLRP